MKTLMRALLSTVLASSVAFAGGAFEGGGGGDLGSEHPVAFEQFRRELRELVSILPFVFYRLETSEELPARIREKLFSGARTVYQGLRNQELEIRERGACVDPVSESAVPASALVIDGKLHLCFSHELLRGGLNQGNRIRRLAALAAHEAAHYLRAITEDEARTVQAVAEAQVSSKLESVAPSLEKAGLWLEEILERIDAAAEAQDPALAGALLTAVVLDLRNWSDQHLVETELGISFFDRAGQERILQLRSRFSALLGLRELGEISTQLARLRVEVSSLRAALVF